MPCWALAYFSIWNTRRGPSRKLGYKCDIRRNSMASIQSTIVMVLKSVVMKLGGPGNCGSPDEGPDASQQTLLATDEEGGHANEVAHGRLGSGEAFGLHLRGELRGQGFA